MIYVTTTEDNLLRFHMAVKNKPGTYGSLNITKPFILLGHKQKDKKINPEFKIIDIGMPGGSAVAFPKNIMLAAYDYKIPDWRTPVTKMLKSKGINVSEIKNDLLIDRKYKFYSQGGIRLENNIIWTHAFFNITGDKNKIIDICGKQSKIPVALEDYGITREDILNALDIQEGEEYFKNKEENK